MIQQTVPKHDEEGELDSKALDDLLMAAENSLDFWDNAWDDEDWNNERRHSMGKVQLPKEIEQALRDYPGPTAVFLMIDYEAALVVKSGENPAKFKGPIPILYRWEMGLYAEGAAIRLYAELQDDPKNPYSLETFLDPAKPDDLKLINILVDQEHLDLHLFDSTMSYWFSKRVHHRTLQRHELSQLLDSALAHIADIPPAHLDFERVRAQFQTDRPM